MDNPRKRRKGQDFKEYESRYEIRGQHHALRGSQRHNHEEPVAVQVFALFREVFLREKSRHKPHECRDDGIDTPEAVKRKADRSGQDPRNRYKCTRGVWHLWCSHSCEQREPADHDGEDVPRAFVSSAGDEKKDSRKERHKDQYKKQHQITPFAMAPMNAMTGPGAMPNRMFATAKTVIGISMSIGEPPPDLSGKRSEP